MKRNLATKFLCAYHDGLFTSVGQQIHHCLQQHWKKQYHIYGFLLSKNVFWYILFLYKTYRNNKMFGLGGVYRVSSLGASFCYELRPKNPNEGSPKISNWEPAAAKELQAVPHKLKVGSVFFVTNIEENPDLKLNYLNLGHAHVLVEILLEGNKRYLVLTHGEYEKQSLSLAYEELA